MRKIFEDNSESLSVVNNEFLYTQMVLIDLLKSSNLKYTLTQKENSNIFSFSKDEILDYLLKNYKVTLDMLKKYENDSNSKVYEYRIVNKDKKFNIIENIIK